MKKKLIIIGIIVILVGAFIYTYKLFTKEDSTNTLTIKEKQWVIDNKSMKYDFEIFNDYPLYGTNGTGVLFDFLDDFEEDVGIEFNRISYLTSSPTSTNSFRFRIVDKNYKLKDTDISLFNDNYVVVSTKYERVNHVSDLKNQSFAIFEDDKEEVQYYLKSANNITLKTYNKIDDIINALNNNEVSSIIIPNIMYLNYTINQDKYYINYYFNEMYKQIILTLSDSNEELNTIVRKYYNKWKLNNYVKEYNKEYINYYVTSLNLSDSDKDKLTSVDYTYGFVENIPYEKLNNDKLVGITGEYIERLKRLGKINIKYKKYDSVSDLKKAIDKKEIDIYFDYYNYSTDNYLATNSYFIEDYVVLGKLKDTHVVSSFESINNQEICMLNNNTLYDYFNNNSKAKIKGYDSIDELVKSAKDRMIVIDKEVYTYYQNTKFSKYSLLYMDTMSSDYKFMVLSDDKVIYNLLNYITSTNSYYNYRNAGLISINSTSFDNAGLIELYMIILACIFAPILIIGLIIWLIRRNKKIKRVKIKDRHKYTDMLTSLKNRNYLNAKLPEWEDCKKFPQAVIIIDLNNVKYVNDNYGHEEGDQLIIRAASKLVNMQLENSEIIRTDGNEFLIYLVGYKEKQISTYANKLTKELKSLPHDFGAAVGYSMIMDSAQSIDDAINEATLEMITKKEESKSK